MNKTFQAMIKTDDLHLAELAASPLAWLEARIRQFPECCFTWLLAHATDEVVWGRVDGGRVLLSRPGDLCAETLIECRLFSEKAELLLWQEDGQPHARLAVDDTTVDRIDEFQLLWGSQVDTDSGTPRPHDGFTPLIEVIQKGMRHSVPIEVCDEDLASGRLRLWVRHYLACDDHTGEVSVALSRLAVVGLFDMEVLK